MQTHLQSWRANASILSLALCLALPAAAKDKEPPAKAPEMSAEHKAMMDAWQKAATPGAQHKQLSEQFAGTWNTKMSAWMEPGGEPIVETGKSVNTAIFDGRQLRMDYTGTFMGQPYTGVGYSGYNNVTGKYHSTWTDNMSTGIFVAEGDYDAGRKTYTYAGQMPDPMKPGTTIAVREVLRVVDKDRHVLEMYEQRDGKEFKTMEIDFKRAK